MNAKLSEGKIKEIIPFTITSKRTKYLGISSPRKEHTPRKEPRKEFIQLNIRPVC